MQRGNSSIKARSRKQMNAKLIKAVRNDPLVGRGSLSSIDECCDDAELWEIICDAESEEEAVRLARDSEGLWLEQGCNCRWGEDDDPELENLRNFMERDKE
jgi:hypothetical protein